MQKIARDELKDMMESNQNFKLIDVLSPDKFDDFHIKGAINVPVSSDKFDEKIESAVDNKSDPIVVYCYDSDCDASPRAAARMEELGFSDVYDYEAGKVDWKEAGLPIE